MASNKAVVVFLAGLKTNKDSNHICKETYGTFVLLRQGIHPRITCLESISKFCIFYFILLHLTTYATGISTLLHYMFSKIAIQRPPLVSFDLGITLSLLQVSLKPLSNQIGYQPYYCFFALLTFSEGLYLLRT